MELPVLTIPPDAVAAARLPRRGMEAELQRRLAAALYSDSIFPGGAACRMAGREKAEWLFYLGQYQIPHPLTEEDCGAGSSKSSGMAGNRLIISNTTPLINFAEIGRFDLLESELGAISVPPAVVAELNARAGELQSPNEL